FVFVVFFFSSRRRHTRWPRDWSSDVCSSDLCATVLTIAAGSIGCPWLLPWRQSSARLRRSALGQSRAFPSSRSAYPFLVDRVARSEERRVGKECRAGWGGGQGRKECRGERWA